MIEFDFMIWMSKYNDKILWLQYTVIRNRAYKLRLNQNHQNHKTNPIQG